MPFTLTHVAAVVPVKKFSGAWMPFTALAMGSMVPDVPKFFGDFVPYAVTHSFPGILTASLPLGLLLYVVFQVLVRTPMLELMPDAISERLGGRRPHTLKYMAGVVAGLIIGAATHVLWDSFTHPFGWGVNQIPQLHNQFILFDRSHGMYKLLQHGSTVVFLPLLAWGLYRWARAPFTRPPYPYHSQLNLPLWLKLGACTLIFVAPALIALTEAWLNYRSFYYGIGPAARAYGGYVLMAVVAASLAIHMGLWILSLRQIRRA